MPCSKEERKKVRKKERKKEKKQMMRYKWKESKSERKTETKRKKNVSEKSFYRFKIVTFETRHLTVAMSTSFDKFLVLFDLVNVYF